MSCPAGLLRLLVPACMALVAVMQSGCGDGPPSQKDMLEAARQRKAMKGDSGEEDETQVAAASPATKLKPSESSTTESQSPDNTGLDETKKTSSAPDQSASDEAAIGKKSEQSPTEPDAAAADHDKPALAMDKVDGQDDVQSPKTAEPPSAGKRAIDDSESPENAPTREDDTSARNAGADGKHSEQDQASPPGESATAKVSKPETTPSGLEPGGLEFGVGDRLKPPNQKLLDETMKELASLYQDEWKLLRTNTERVEFARDLLERATKSTESIVRYALLLTSCRIAAAAGDVKPALDAIEAIEKDYDEDTYPIRLEVAEAIIKLKSDSVDSQLVSLADGLFEEAFEKDDFEAAAKMYGVRYAAARREKDTQRQRQLLADKRRMEIAKNAFKKLTRTLDNAEAVDGVDVSSDVGKYHCFVKGKWSRGLPLLAKGLDPELRELANAEIAGSGTGDGWIRIADLWWDYGEVEEDHQRAIRLHAVYLYQLAIPDADDGVDKLRAEARVRQAVKILGREVVNGLKEKDHRFLDLVGSTRTK